MTYKTKFSFKLFLASIGLAFFIDIKSINFILKAMLNIDEEGGFMSILYIGIIFIILIASLLQENRVFKINKYVVFVVLFILIWFQYTNATIGLPRISFQFLCVFTIAAFLAPSIVQISPRIFIKSVMLLPTIGIFYSSSIFSTQDSLSNTISMQVSYAFMVPIMATVVYIINYFKQEDYLWKVIGVLSALVNTIYFYQLISYGSRGPFVCVLAMLLYYYLVKKRNGGGIIINNKKIFIILSLGLVLMGFFVDFFSFISSTLHALGINLNVIDKSLNMLNAGDMSNGREYIAGVAIQKFFEEPIFGHGLDQFENNTGINYPHNFILQILYDGGLFFFFILFVPLLYKTYKKIKACNEDEYSMIPFFFFCSVPGALLSSDMWKNERLWLFFGVIFASYIFREVSVKQHHHKKTVLS